MLEKNKTRILCCVPCSGGSWDVHQMRRIPAAKQRTKVITLKWTDKTWANWIVSSMQKGALSHHCKRHCHWHVVRIEHLNNTRDMESKIQLLAAAMTTYQLHPKYISQTETVYNISSWRWRYVPYMNHVKCFVIMLTESSACQKHATKHLRGVLFFTTNLFEF